MSKIEHFYWRYKFISNDYLLLYRRKRLFHWVGLDVTWIASHVKSERGTYIWPTWIAESGKAATLVPNTIRPYLTEYQEIYLNPSTSLAVFPLYSFDLKWDPPSSDSLLLLRPHYAIDTRYVLKIFEGKLLYNHLGGFVGQTGETLCLHVRVVSLHIDRVVLCVESLRLWSLGRRWRVERKFEASWRCRKIPNHIISVNLEFVWSRVLNPKYIGSGQH